MRKIFLLILVCNCFYQYSYSQKQGNIWCFGNGALINFNSGNPVAGTCANMILTSNIIEGCASISDSSGNLLFYASGENVWNRNNNIMPNGSGLAGNWSTTQAAFIVPKPLSDSLFYLFTPGVGCNDTLSYSIIDMCLDNGLGDILTGEKNIFLLDSVGEKLTGTNHSNGTDIWLLAHKLSTSSFYAYQISQNGIIDTVISRIGQILSSCPDDEGEMKISPNGQKLAFVDLNTYTLEVFDFDPSTGIVSNEIDLTISPILPYSIEFSPDNNNLYVTGLNGTCQYNLTAGGGTQVAINASNTLLPTNGSCTPCNMQLGPDGKIYANRGGSAIAVITNPNVVGVGCNYTINGFSLDSGMSGSCFPSFISSYQYHNTKSNCLNESVPIVNFSSGYTLSIYPNPASTSITIHSLIPNSNPQSLIITDVLGNEVYHQAINNSTQSTINISQLSNGVYFYQLTNNKEIYRGKFVKE